VDWKYFLCTPINNVFALSCPNIIIAHENLCPEPVGNPGVIMDMVDSNMDAYIDVFGRSVAKHNCNLYAFQVDNNDGLAKLGKIFHANFDLLGRSLVVYDSSSYPSLPQNKKLVSVHTTPAQVHISTGNSKAGMCEELLGFANEEALCTKHGDLVALRRQVFEKVRRILRASFGITAEEAQAYKIREDFGLWCDLPWLDFHRLETFHMDFSVEAQQRIAQGTKASHHAGHCSPGRGGSVGPPSPQCAD
jgi:hypothetical protein